jgi:hypothetical protein
LLRKLGYAFHRIDGFGELREQRRLVAGAGADLEHLVVRLELQRLEVERLQRRL